jgi:MoaA/NifB/PqqE/SkfB family radical SAM enzyme
MRVDHPFRAAFDLLVHKAPIEAQLVVTRRCNLSCGYCSEYDDHSEEVPFDTLRSRIDALHALRAVNIALLGGEPLLHSRIEDIVAHAASRAQVSMTTNGFLLDRAKIERLGQAGLANLQISIDAVRPDRELYVQKTLRSLRPKLERLAAHARFDVHVTTVLCRENLHELDELMRALARFPFRVSLNIQHDDSGRTVIQGPHFEEAWRRHFEEGKPFSYIEEEYGQRLLSGERPAWTCGAGGRFLYVDEEGTVELCSAQRGRIGKQVTDYTEADLERHRRQPKGCEKGCAVLCVYRDSLIDDDPMALAKAMVRSFRQGTFNWGTERETLRPDGVPEPRRHLPLVEVSTLARKSLTPSE